MVIRVVLFSPEVTDKLWVVHRLSQWEVEQVIYDPETEPRWDIDPVHGGRVIIRGLTKGAEPRLVFVALRPVDLEDGVWACITASAPSDGAYGSEESETRDDR